MPEVSPSVLIIRLDAIGDALALTPLLAALRRHAIPVDVVLSRANAGVFTALAARRAIIAGFALRSSDRSNLGAIERFGCSLRANGYSHAFVATEDPGGYRLAAAVAAPNRVGFINAWGKPLKALWARRLLSGSVHRHAGLDPRAPHECEVLFGLGRSLVGDEAPTRELAQLRPLVIDGAPEPDERIAVQVTDKWERLGIAFNQVIAMVRRVAASGIPHLLSARTEFAYAQRVGEATALPVSYFDAIVPWKNAIAAAPAIVTPDSAALHVAGMVGTPTVAVFPPQRGYMLQVARWAPWAAPHRVIRADQGWPVRVEDALAQLVS